MLTVTYHTAPQADFRKQTFGNLSVADYLLDQMNSQVLIVASAKASGTHTIEIIPEHLIGNASSSAGNREGHRTTISSTDDRPSKSRKKGKQPKYNSARIRKKVHVNFHDKRKKTGIRCTFSQCLCSENRCVVYRSIKAPVVEAWKKFIQDNDPDPRIHKNVRLCRCHFKDLKDETPMNEKMDILLNPEVSISPDSTNHKFLKASKKLSAIEQSLSKVFNEDQVKKLIEDKPFVHYSQKTVEESHQIYKACGAKGYQLLLKRGYPLPTIRTLQRLRGKNTTDNSFDYFQEPILVVESVIDEENQ